MRLAEFVKSDDTVGLQRVLQSGMWSDDELNEALLVSAREGNVTCYEHLVRSGASPLYTTYSQKNAMHMALQHGGGSPHLIRAILQTSGDLLNLLDSTDSFQMTALSYAALQGNTEALHQIVEASKGLKEGNLVRECLDWESNHPRGTPLILACKQGHREAARYLISLGANVNHSDRGCTTPLMVAAQKGHAPCIKVLLEEGAKQSINHSDMCGRTALLFAVQGGHREACQTLIQYEADVNQVDRAGSSPLMWAISKGNMGIMNMLVASQADIHWTNEDGSSPFLMAIKRDELEMAQKLVKLGVDVKQKCRGRDTAVHIAAMKSNSKCLPYLLSHNFVHKYDINVSRKDERTPLTQACERTYLSNVKTLLKHGANPDLRDMGGSGLLPLVRAIKVSMIYPIEGTEVVKILLRYGCDVRQTESTSLTLAWGVECNYNQTPMFELALRTGLMPIAKMLWWAGSLQGLAYSWHENNPPWNSSFVSHPVHPFVFTAEFKKNALSFLRKNVNQPRSLSNASIICIRYALHWNIPQKVKHLGLPEAIQDLINLPELDTIDKSNRQTLSGDDYLEVDEEILSDMTETSESEHSGIFDEERMNDFGERLVSGVPRGILAGYSSETDSSASSE